MAKDAVDICTLFLLSAFYRQVISDTAQYVELLPL